MPTLELRNLFVVLMHRHMVLLVELWLTKCDGRVEYQLLRELCVKRCDTAEGIKAQG